MYGTYNGIKDALTSDDIAGIDSLYAVRQPDQFNSNGHTDSTYANAANINSYIGGNDQLAISGLENMTSVGNEWYYINAPAGTASSMTVTVQSSALSSFAPQFQVYSASLTPLARNSAPEVLGATISSTVTGVSQGTGYYIRVFAAGGPGAIGTYGLLVNFSNSSQSPIAPPNTVVAAQPSQGGGTSDCHAPGGNIDAQFAQLPDTLAVNNSSISTATPAVTINPLAFLATQVGVPAGVINQDTTSLLLGALDTVLAGWKSKSGS
jgi:hypothetical protein